MLCGTNHSLQLHSKRPSVLQGATGDPPGASPCRGLAANRCLVEDAQLLQPLLCQEVQRVTGKVLGLHCQPEAGPGEQHRGSRGWCLPWRSQ